MRGPTRRRRSQRRWRAQVAEAAARVAEVSRATRRRSTRAGPARSQPVAERRPERAADGASRGDSTPGRRTTEIALRDDWAEDEERSQTEIQKREGGDPDRQPTPRAHVAQAFGEAGEEALAYRCGRLPYLQRKQEDGARREGCRIERKHPGRAGSLRRRSPTPPARRPRSRCREQADAARLPAGDAPGFTIARHEPRRTAAPKNAVAPPNSIAVTTNIHHFITPASRAAAVSASTEQLTTSQPIITNRRGSRSAQTPPATREHARTTARTRRST